MSDAGVWALGHQVYCQLVEFLRQTWQIQTLINKSQVVLRLKIVMLTSEVEPHQQMRILHPSMKRHTLILGVRALHAELQMYRESEMSLEEAWTLEPSVEGMRWMPL